MQLIVVSSLVVWGENVFVPTGGLGQSAVSAWDPEHGVRHLLPASDDNTEYAYGLGTDGKDMVWTLLRVLDSQAGDGQYSLMTVPFTTDPAVVAAEARVVREERDGSIWPEAAYRVGCGYAARRTDMAELAVTRLADGAEWIVERSAPPDRGSWSFGPALGVTCDEVFVELFSDDGYYPNTHMWSIARIRLDSLGEPTFPPP